MRVLFVSQHNIALKNTKIVLYFDEYGVVEIYTDKDGYAILNEKLKRKSFFFMRANGFLVPTKKLLDSNETIKLAVKTPIPQFDASKRKEIINLLVNIYHLRFSDNLDPQCLLSESLSNEVAILVEAKLKDLALIDVITFTKETTADKKIQFKITHVLWEEFQSVVRTRIASTELHNDKIADDCKRLLHQLHEVDSDNPILTQCQLVDGSKYGAEIGCWHVRTIFSLIIDQEPPPKVKSTIQFLNELQNQRKIVVLTRNEIQQNQIKWTFIFLIEPNVNYQSHVTTVAAKYFNSKMHLVTEKNLNPLYFSVDTENELLRWLFKHDHHLHFLVAIIRLSLYGQSDAVREKLIQKGMETIKVYLNSLRKHRQTKGKLEQGNFTIQFIRAVENTVKRTLSHEYSNEELKKFICDFTELHTKAGNPEGAYQLLKQIEESIYNILFKDFSPETWKKFSTFWNSIKKHHDNFAHAYIMGELWQKPLAQNIRYFLFISYLVLIALAVSSTISLLYALSWPIVSAVGYCVWLNERGFNRFIVTTKLNEEEQNKLYQIVGRFAHLKLRTVIYHPYQYENTANIISREDNIPRNEFELVPTWGQKQDEEKPIETKTRAVKRRHSPAVTPAKKISNEEIIDWENPFKTNARFHKLNKEYQKEDNTVYEFSSDYMTHGARLFGIFHPKLNTIVQEKQLSQFKNTLQVGRLIDKKSRGFNGIKPSFTLYHPIGQIGKQIYSEYKIKLAKQKERLEGHEIARETINGVECILIGFDGYSEKHKKEETASKRKIL